MSCIHTTHIIHNIMSCIHTTHIIHNIMSCTHTTCSSIHTIMSCIHTIHTIHTIMSCTHTIHTIMSITHTPLHLLIERSMNVQQRVAHHHQLRGVHHRPHLREHYASHHHASPTLPSPLLLAPPTRVHRP